MKSFLYIMVHFFLLSIAQSIGAQDFNEEISKVVKARIKADNLEGTLSLTALADNSSEVYYPLNYLLVAIKKDENGNTSSNKQEGKFVIKPNETQLLSQIKINLGKKGALKAYLFIKDEENKQLITKDSLHINEENFGQAKSGYLPEGNLELNGITIDETRTKFGKQFYDQFYLNSLLQNFRFPGTVTISEAPGLGRSTRVMVYYNDQEFYNFMTSPDDELIDNEAKKVLTILKQIINTRKDELRNL